LMGKIPEALNERMNADLFYTRCCISMKASKATSASVFVSAIQISDLWIATASHGVPPFVFGNALC